MLTNESLIEQAKLRNMPATKTRGILREYLQILILKELYRLKSGRKLYFTGGTYLRLAHGLKRFSEDLDFNTSALTQKEFEDTIKGIKNELKRVGAEANISFAHWGNIYVSKMIFPEIEKVYGITSRYSKKHGITIKIETNKPKYRIKDETHVISGFGEFYPCICTDRSILFADKVDAFTKKKIGRHLYDIIFMLANKYPIDKKTLAILGLKDDPLKLISKRIKNLSSIELKKQAETLRPFLFDEKEADLLINAKDILPPLLENYKKERVR